MHFPGQKPRLTKKKKAEDCTPKTVAAFRHHTHTPSIQKEEADTPKPDDRPELRNNFQLSNYTPKLFPINDITPGDQFQLITLHPEI